MSGINIHYKPDVPVTYFSLNVSQVPPINAIVVNHAFSPPALALHGATQTAEEPERGLEEGEAERSGRLKGRFSPIGVRISQLLLSFQCTGWAFLPGVLST